MARLTERNGIGELIIKRDITFRVGMTSLLLAKEITDKLGQLEDLMEKYSIPDVEYLEKCIIYADKYGELSEELGIDLTQLRRKRKYLIIDVENFIKNCKKLVYKTTDNELVISLNAKLVMDDKIKKDVEDYLKESVIKTLLGEIENKSFTKEELENEEKNISNN